jgi:hypothetical protein
MRPFHTMSSSAAIALSAATMLAICGAAAAAAESPPHAGLRAAYIASVQDGAGPAYRVQSEKSGTLRAGNAAQGMSIVFAPSGLEVAVGANDGQTVHLFLDAVGCGSQLQALPIAAARAAGNRAVYERDGVSEWYVNGPLGVEQGFDVSERRSCRDPRAPLTLSMNVTGALPQVLPGLDAALLTTVDGAVLMHYTDLHVVDAAGRVLNAWLSADAALGSLSIHVDDSSAVYPIVVDPLIWVQNEKLSANDAQAGDAFGYSVAIDGDTAVIGAPDDDNEKGSDAGAVHVFRRSPGGTSWSHAQRLVSNDTTLTAGDRFGRAVAIRGNLLVVGAPIDNASRGMLQVFERSTAVGDFVFIQKIITGDNANGDRFGSAVALGQAPSATTIVAAAPFDDLESGTDVGSVYVYVRSGSTFVQQAKLTAGASGAANDRFGSGLALDGNTVVVGVPGDDDNGTESGSAFVYVRNESSWSQQAKLAPPDGQAGDQFGAAVSIAGDSALFGAPQQTFGAGKAYVYTRQGGVWLQQSLLVPEASSLKIEFGRSVALSGNVAAVAAPLRGSIGAVFMFERANGNWSAAGRSDAADTLAGDQLGGALAMTGEWVLAGAALHDLPATNAGAAYLFNQAPAAPGPDGIFSDSFEPFH